MKSTRFLLCLLCLLITLIGCLPNDHPSSPYPANATLPINNSLPSLTSVPVTSTTLLSSIDSIPTAWPTLDANKAYLLLQEFLKNDPLCKLPCWGGITTGKSTLTDAQRQFAMLSGVSNNNYFGIAKNTWHVGALNISYPLDNITVGIRLGYMASIDDEKILLVSFSTGQK